VALGVARRCAHSLGEIANSTGPDMPARYRRLNGVGETVGGIVVVALNGANARLVITDVKRRLDQAMGRSPAGRQIQVAYDRTH